MTKEKWNTLTADQRKKAVIKHDTSGTMKLPQWAPLLENLCRPYEMLSPIQQGVVAELP